jgi:hypothetical protein
MVIHDPVTEYHRQNDEVLCGAACAQMILHQIDNTVYELQSDLNSYAYDNRDEEGWASEPTGLAKTMIEYDRRPNIGYRIFNESVVPDSDEAFKKITYKIIWTLFEYGIPPIVCTDYGNHWILVTGYEAERHPINSDDTGFEITKLFISNPYPDAEPGIVHKMMDSCSDNGRGGSTSFLLMDEWKTTLTPILLTTSKWYNQLVAICDPKDAPKKIEKKYLSVQKLRGDKIISPAQAAQIALKEIEYFPEKIKSQLSVVYSSVKPGKPVLVKRIDTINEFYYIVPLNGTDGKTYSVIRLDARYGNIKEVSYPKNENKPFQSKLLPANKIKFLAAQAIQSDKKGFKKIFTESLFISPVMIWKPCKQSLNRYYPFYLVLYGSKRIYVRIDGKVFTKLTNPLLGM